MEKYILIINTTPMEMELSDHLYTPELQRSLYIIKTIPSYKGVASNSSLTLFDHFNIEIIDKEKHPSTLTINHFSVRNIEYNHATFEILFIIDEGQIIYGHKVSTMRSIPADPDIRSDIVSSIKKLSNIQTSLSIANINSI